MTPVTRRPADWFVGGNSADEPLFNEYIGRHLQPVIHRLAPKFGLDDASDATQTAATELWQHILKTRRRFTEGHLRMQLMMRAKKRCVRGEQSTATRDRVSEELAVYAVERQEFEDTGALESMVARELRARYERIVDDMPATYREAFDLVAGQGMSPNETAEMLGITPDAVRKRMRQAHQYIFDARTALDAEDEAAVQRVQRVQRMQRMQQMNQAANRRGGNS